MTVKAYILVALSLLLAFGWGVLAGIATSNDDNPEVAWWPKPKIRPLPQAAISLDVRFLDIDVDGIVFVFSNSVEDREGGRGAASVSITGLTMSGDWIQERILLNGLTPVWSINRFSVTEQAGEVSAPLDLDPYGDRWPWGIVTATVNGEVVARLEPKP